MDFSKVITRLQAVPPRTRAALVNLSAAHMVARPPEGGWSIAQVFEHLCLNNDLYVDGVLPRAVEQARQSRHGARTWRPSLVGRLLISAMRETNTRRVPAPGRFRVAHAVRPDVVESFLVGMARLEALIGELEGHDLRTGVASPVSPLLRMNVGDACVLMVEHAHRHLAQVERTRRAVGG